MVAAIRSLRRSERSSVSCSRQCCCGDADGDAGAYVAEDGGFAAAVAADGGKSHSDSLCCRGGPGFACGSYP